MYNKNVTMIKLTYCHPKINKKGLDKLKSIRKKRISEDDTDSPEFYERIGIPIPDYLKDIEEEDDNLIPDENGIIEVELEDDEVEVREYPMILDEKLIDYAIGFEKFTTLYLSDDTDVNVKETIEEINKKLNI